MTTSIHSALRPLTLCLATLCLFTLTSSAQESSLDTTYASGNGQSGNMFDVQASENIIVTRIDAHIDTGNWDVEIYTTPNSYFGKQNDPTVWTLVGSVNVNGGGDIAIGGVKTPIPLALDVAIAAGQSVGFYVTLSNGSEMNYTNGSLEGTVFAADSNVAITEGLGVAYPFSAFFSPRVWNGTLYYKMDCNGNGIADDVDLLNDPTADIDGDGNLDVCLAPPLMADTYGLTMGTGGVQTMTLTRSHPGDLYFLLGSASGTSPGMPAGPFTLPLNMDAYFMHSLLEPSVNPLTNSFGTFTPGTGTSGTGTVTFTLQPAYDPVLIGTTAHHAFVVIDPATGNCTAVSNAIPITFLP